MGLVKILNLFSGKRNQDIKTIVLKNNITVISYVQ